MEANMFRKVKKIAFSKNTLMYIFFLLMMILVMVNKRNMQVDEVLTYGLANYESGWMTPSGEIYSPSESVVLEYAAVHQDSRFNYKNVWDNQLGDTHPPLYYMLVHTICSLFPDTFSTWYAGIINIFFALLTLFTVRCLVHELTQNREVVALASILFICSAGILSSATFLRMYVMAMFEVTFVTLLFVRAITRGYTWKFYLYVMIISILGALTHYYFIIYLFFLCLFWGIYLLINRRIKDIVFFIVSMALSGGLSVLVFPGMVKHIFTKESHRGQQSIENLKQASLAEYGNRLKEYYSFVNEQLLGNMLTYIIIAVLVYLIWCWINGKSKEGGALKPILSVIRNVKAYWIISILPSICYFFLVSKIAVYITSRYLSPIFAVTIAVFAVLIYNVGCKIIRSNMRYIVLCIFVAVIIVNSWKLCSWEFLCMESTALLEKAEKYSEENNLYIYDSDWKIYPSFYEIAKYKSAYFMNQKHLSSIIYMPYISDWGLVVSITNSCDAENILNQILDVCPFLDSYEKMGTYAYATSWHLFSRNFDSYQCRIYDYEHKQLIGCEDISEDGNICMSVQDTTINGGFNQNTGYGTLWIGNRVFDIKGGAISEGSNIRLWNYNGTNAQSWKIQKNLDGSYTFLSSDANFAMTRGLDGNIYLDRMETDNESQKWWLEIEESY